MAPKKDVKKIIKVLDRLEDLWGQERDPMVKPFQDPLDGLILTVLSQNTNDLNRDKAFENLKRTCPLWEMAASLKETDLSDVIRPAGIANVKARRILGLLSLVREKFGEYSLKEMSQWDGDKAFQFLKAIPGVGPKTAACVLAFDLNIPAFPVDTHVARFCRRMKWVSESMAPAKIQEYMETLVPPERKKGAHLNIICHGKTICKARSPQCGKCPLKMDCPGRQL